MPIFLIAKDKNLRLIWVLSSATAISNRRWTKKSKNDPSFMNMGVDNDDEFYKNCTHSTSHAEFYKIGIDLNSVVSVYYIGELGPTSSN